jgi:hypothetical protein
MGKRQGKGERQIKGEGGEWGRILRYSFFFCHYSLEQPCGRRRRRRERGKYGKIPRKEEEEYIFLIFRAVCLVFSRTV